VRTTTLAVTVVPPDEGEKTSDDTTSRTALNGIGGYRNRILSRV
jgi:hypothetical protein